MSYQKVRTAAGASEPVGRVVGGGGGASVVEGVIVDGVPSVVVVVGAAEDATGELRTDVGLAGRPASTPEHDVHTMAASTSEGRAARVTADSIAHRARAEELSKS